MNKVNNMYMDICRGFSELYRRYPPLVSYTALKNGQLQPVDVANEVLIPLTINNHPWSTIAATPCQLESLIIGYLFTEELIKTIEDIATVWVQFDDNLTIHVELTKSVELHASVLGTSGLKSQVKVPRSEKFNLHAITSPIPLSIILRAQQYMVESSIAWKQTGAMHFAGIFNSKGETLAVAEDVGRHNALDKVIGEVLIQNVDLSDTFCCISGRLSAEMVRKIIRIGIPILVSKAAPLSGGIDLAKKTDLTLAGFARNPDCNIYNGEFRINRQL
jgi:FdhD protein/cysteine desulfurase